MGYRAGKSRAYFFPAGDEEEISISQPERFDRADVARSLSELGEVRDAGFTLKIPEILTLAEKYTRLEVFLSDGSEKEVIFSSTGKELEDFCMDCLMEYRIDKEQILGKNTLLVEGWVLDQQGSDEVLVEDRAGKPVKCTINRGRRPDVEEERGITAPEAVRSVFPFKWIWKKPETRSFWSALKDRRRRRNIWWMSGN